MSAAGVLEAPILIVEDDEPTAELERRVLARSGRRTRIVSGVHDAIEAMRKESFLVILLDYRLPDGEPWPVLEAAQSAIPRIPVILVTAMGDERIAAEVIHRGGADYLIKTGDFSEQLPAAIERLVRQGEVEQANQRLAAIVESSDDAVLSKTLEGVILSWNPGAERLFGHEVHEAVGRSDEFLVPPELVDEEKQINERVRRGESTRQMETVRTRRDGAPVDVSTTTSPIFDSKRRVIGAASISRDISDRKRSEEALRTSEERYRLLFENNPQPVWAFDIETLAFLAVSDAACAHYGYSREEFLRLTIKDIRPSEDVPALLHALAGPSDGVFRHRKKDGTLIEVEVTSRPLVFDGHPARFVVALDVTEHRKLEAQLRQSQKMEAVGQLAGGIAHDFNNVLTAIFGYAGLLAAALEPGDPGRAEVDEIVRASERAAALTKQLLAFSRRQVLEPVVLEVNGLVVNLEKMLARLIGEDVRLVSRLTPGVGNVRADAGQIEQVIMNLVVNARDAMPKGGRLTIETANADLDETYTQLHAAVRPGPYILIAISDTGTGMDAATQARIFEPFFTTKEKGKGTGLGLATVYGIVKQSNGYIWVYSEPGKGTTFKIYLPRVDERPTVAAPKLAEAAPLHGDETILFVDDEASIRALSRRVLEAQGYRVIEAGTGKEAMEILAREGGAVNLLVTDLVMPDMTGTELAERAAEIQPDLKTLYISGYTENGVIRNGMLERTSAFLQKPFAPRLLSRRVRELLDSKE